MTNAFFLGYDLNDNNVQICYCREGAGQMSPISSVAGGENYIIPSVLCKRKGSNQWLFGDEAVRTAARGDGYLVDNLIRRCLIKDTVTLEGDSFHPERLLELFVRKTFQIIASVCDLAQAHTMVMAVERLDSPMVELMRRILDAIAIKPRQIRFQDYKESFYYYTYNQNPALYNYDVVLFSYYKETIRCLYMTRNRKTVPTVIDVSERIFPSMQDMGMAFDGTAKEAADQKRDEIFAEIIGEVFGKNIISSVFLIGDGFGQDWMKTSLQLLCKNRKVFLGQNLFSEGACYAAMGSLNEGDRDTVYLGDYKVQSNIGIPVENSGEQSIYPLILAGNNWFEEEQSCDVIPDQVQEIELHIFPLGHRDPQVRTLDLTGLPQRPNKTTRLRIHAWMETASLVRIEVRDLGFGEWFPATDKVWEFEFLL